MPRQILSFYVVRVPEALVTRVKQEGYVIGKKNGVTVNTQKEGLENGCADCNGPICSHARFFCHVFQPDCLSQVAPLQDLRWVGTPAATLKLRAELP